MAAPTKVLPSDFEKIRYKFCKTFLLAAESNLNSKLKDPSLTSQIAQNIVTAFCSGLELATISPAIGKSVAKVVNIIIQKVDQSNRQSTELILQDTIDADTTKEFQQSFRKLMLRSALEIFHSYENQLLALEHKIKRENSIRKLFKRSFSRESATPIKETKSSSGKSRLKGMFIIAEYAASRCIDYLVEQKKCDYPHNHVLTPSLLTRGKSKYEQWFTKSLSLNSGNNNIVVKKTGAQFFSDPIPAYPNFTGNDLATKSDMSVLLDNENEKLLNGPKINIDARLKMSLRRPFDFEYANFLRNIQNSRNNFVLCVLNDSHDLTPLYFEWRDPSKMVADIYEDLMRDEEFDKDEAMFNQFENILKILVGNSQKIDQIQNSLNSVQNNVQKIVECQNELRVNPNIEEIKIIQEEIKLKVDHLHNVVKSELTVSKNEDCQPVTNFKMKEVAPSNFTGRENILSKLQNLIEAAAGESEMLNRIVIISGMGGIGKSSIAKKYAQEYTRQNLNIAWLNAESEDSLKTSLMGLAMDFKICKDILKKAKKSGMDRHDLNELVIQVYRHFSNHVERGLFILDNANQLRTTKDEFGIEDFLPSEKLQKYPIFLVTSRNKNWAGTIKFKIHVDGLDREEALAFLMAGFGLTGRNFSGFVPEKVLKLAGLLDGYPLALNLAVAQILENLQLAGGSNFSSDSSEYLNILELEIQNYIDEFHSNGLKWINFESKDHSLNHYDKIMATVWRGTMDKLEGLSKSGDELCTIGLDLLKLISYLPPDVISIEMCYFIYYKMEVCDELRLYESAKVTHSKIRKAFGILEKFSMVSVIHEENYVYPYYKKVRTLSVKIHRLVQKWTRESLKLKKDYRILVELAKYCQLHVTIHDYFDSLREHLRDAGWPEGTYRQTIFIDRFGFYPKNVRPWKEIVGIFEQFPELVGCDVEFYEISNLALDFFHNFLDGRREREDVGKFLERTLSLGLKYRGNEIMQFLTVDITSIVSQFEKPSWRRERLFRKWIRRWFDFLQNSPQVMSTGFTVYHHRSFVHLVQRLLSHKEIIGRITRATHSRFGRNYNLSCLPLLSRVLLSVPSWPSNVWTFANKDGDNILNNKTSLSLLKVFLDNNGVELLVTALTRFQEIFLKGHFLQMQSFVIFGVIQNLAYFDKPAKKLLKNKDFVNILVKLFESATRQSDRTVDDRRALVGIVFSWFALLYKEERSKYLVASDIHENMTNFARLFEIRQPYELPGECCRPYFMEVRHGRFSGCRSGIIQTFLKNHNESSDNVLYCTAQKLMEIMAEKSCCYQLLLLATFTPV